jgi:hypothetical protein
MYAGRFARQQRPIFSDAACRAAGRLCQRSRSVSAAESLSGSEAVESGAQGVECGPLEGIVERAVSERVSGPLELDAHAGQIYWVQGLGV